MGSLMRWIDATVPDSVALLVTGALFLLWCAWANRRVRA
jgi:hypothetical protein